MKIYKRGNNIGTSYSEMSPGTKKEVNDKTFSDGTSSPQVLIKRGHGDTFSESLKNEPNS